MAKKPAKTRPRKISAAEIDERLGKARLAAVLARSRASVASRELAYVLEVMADAAQRAIKATAPVLLKVRASPQTPEMVRRTLVDGKPRKRGENWRPIWSVVGEFDFRPRIGYSALFLVFEKWSTKQIKKLVGSLRIARITVVYKDERGKEMEYTLGDATSYDLCISRALKQTDPEDTEGTFGQNIGSLAARYDNAQGGGKRSKLGTLRVWLASNEMKSKRV